MRLATWVLTAAALAVIALPVRADVATSSTYRLVVDRIDHEPASVTGTRLSIHVSALTLQGQRIQLTDPKSIKTTVGSSELRAPLVLGRYAATSSEMAIVIVVQATLDYGEVLPVISETLNASLLSKLPDHTQIAVLPYGESTGSGKLGTLKAARSKVEQLGHDGTAGDPALLETVERALLLLRKAKTEPEGRALRKMILVIGDGRDRAGDRERVTRVGQRAAREGVRIHSFAHSPDDQRRPLLLLGELSRRSLGTFRWLQRGKADSWTPAFKQLEDEISNQYVLTYFLSADEDPSGKKLKVATVGRTEATSADRQPDLKVPSATCGGEECAGYCVSDRCVVPAIAEGRGILGWTLLIGGILVGVIVALGLIGYAMSKRAPRIPLPPGVLPPGMAPGMAPGIAAGVPPGATVPGQVGGVPGLPGGTPGAVVPGQPGAVHGVPGAAPGAAPGATKKRWWQRQKPVAAPAVVPGVPASLPGGRPVPQLLILSGPRTGERVALRHGFLIGKAPGCDLLLEDGFTSSHHAQIGMDHFGNCRLYDRGSTNGTFLNGVRVTEAVLEHGVSIRIGSTELRFLAQ